MLRTGRPASVGRRLPIAAEPTRPPAASHNNGLWQGAPGQHAHAPAGATARHASTAVASSGTGCRDRRVRNRQVQRVQAGTIGFDLPGANSAKDAERTAGQLLEAAASLLLYRAVIKTPTSQAFLRLLAHVQKGTTPQLLDAYGEFYGHLAGGGFASWMDYVLDQILVASSNPWAKALAKHGPSRASDAMRGAAGYDLDVMQQLAVAEATLVSWIKGVAPGVPDAWPSAATWLPPDPELPEDVDSGIPALGKGGVAEVPPYLLGPLTEQQRQSWRAHIGGKWRWSEALPELSHLYAARGLGLMGQYSTLQWYNGAFQAFHVKQADDNPVRARFRFTECYAMQRNALWLNLMRHMNGQPSNHVLALGDGRSCQGYFLWEAAVEAAAGMGLRFVRLTGKEVSNILELGRALGDHPRTRFVVVIDPLEVGDKGSEAYTALLTALSGFGGTWPDNALLVVSAYSTTAHVADMALSELSRFPSTRLLMGQLTEAEYLNTVTTLMGLPDPNGNPAISAALQYGYQQGFSVRSAYEYALESHLLGHPAAPVDEEDETRFGSGGGRMESDDIQ